jgi:hypothetical protein
MHSLVPTEGPFSAAPRLIVSNCHIFHHDQDLLPKPDDDFQSGDSVPSFRVFANAVGDKSVEDLSVPSDELKLATVSPAVADYEAAHSPQGRRQTAERVVCVVDDHTVQVRASVGELHSRKLRGEEGNICAVIWLRGGSVCASATGLRNVRMEEGSSTFKFIVGNCCYECCSHAAEFLSPRVSLACRADATIDEVKIEVDDAEGLFKEVISVADGCSISVDSSNRKSFASMLGALGNFELLGRLSWKMT